MDYNDDIEEGPSDEAVANHKQFVADIEDAGLTPQDYHGRFFWHGPAVAVDDLQEALGATKVKCQWDSLGMGFIVYPVTSRSER
jgi:hypothetical protein